MIRDDFPYFKNSKKIYLDSAATTQKPYQVIESITDYYSNYCSNTHRGSYHDGNKATIEFEGTREYIKKFINAKSSNQIIFTKGVTEGINMVALSYVKNNFKTVIISSLEHHSNITPWHMLGYKPGNGLEIIRYKKDLSIDLEHFESLLKLNQGAFVSITHVSNAFGVIHPIKEITKLAHKYNCVVMVDGAQSTSRFKVDVIDLDVDFYICSGHKNYGPTGIGFLYASKNVLQNLKPYQTGGAAIESVSYNSTVLLDPPLCYEAGTQNIAGVIGLGSALKYIDKVTYKVIGNTERILVEAIHNKLKEIPEVIIYTSTNKTVGNVSFNIKNITPIDVGILLDKQGVSVRCGHHCAMPTMESLKIDGTIRISLGVYNQMEDIDKFFSALKKAISILKR